MSKNPLPFGGLGWATYIPEKSVSMVQYLIEKHNFTLKIVNQRQTKHGDFRKLPNGRFQITINNNLNPYQFLLTLIHEIAHLVGIPHINVKDALMNPILQQNQINELSLTKSDILNFKKNF